MRSRSASIALAAGLMSLALGLYAGPSHAQVDLSGNWTLENFQDYQIRLIGPNFVDYLGIPLNAYARAAAVNYSVDTVEELQRECQPWPIHYLLLGPFGFRMWSTTGAAGEVEAWHVSGSIDHMPITIWVDGRAQPGPQALHTYGGYTTGTWHGDTLVTTTTHIKDGFLTRNGVPSSNQETMTMFITRHNELLTITGIIRDPVYLTAPYVLSRSWKISTAMNATFVSTAPMNCTPEEEDPGLSDGYHVATLLPGTNPLLHLMPDTYHISLDAALGGAQTMYPEFAKTLSSHYTPPLGKCKTNCCGTGDTLVFDQTVLHCPAL